jgi:hypothetical protein
MATCPRNREGKRSTRRLTPFRGRDAGLPGGTCVLRCEVAVDNGLDECIVRTVEKSKIEILA